MYDSTKSLVPKFFNETSSSYEKIVTYCTFGKDKYWKNQICEYLPNGDSFLDLACGTGILTRKIAKKFPNGSVVGIDITLSYLKMAKKKSLSEKNVSYLHQDAETLNLSKKFDCITASYLPKYCNPTILVEKCIRHLKPCGKIIFHDFTYPKNMLVQSLWILYFKVLNLTGFFLPQWKESFANLPKLIKSSTWLDTYESEMKKYGLAVKRIPLTWNSSAILVAQKL